MLIFHYAYSKKMLQEGENTDISLLSAVKVTSETKDANVS